MQWTWSALRILRFVVFLPESRELMVLTGGTPGRGSLGCLILVNVWWGNEVFVCCVNVWINSRREFCSTMKFQEEDDEVIHKWNKSTKKRWNTPAKIPNTNRNTTHWEELAGEATQNGRVSSFYSCFLVVVLRWNEQWLSFSRRLTAGTDFSSCRCYLLTFKHEKMRQQKEERWEQMLHTEDGWKRWCFVVVACSPSVRLFVFEVQEKERRERDDDCVFLEKQ